MLKQNYAGEWEAEGILQPEELSWKDAGSGGEMGAERPKQELLRGCVHLFTRDLGSICYVCSRVPKTTMLAQVYRAQPPQGAGKRGKGRQAGSVVGKDTESSM